MNILRKIANRRVSVATLATIGLIHPSLAQDATNIGGIATQISSQVANVGKLLVVAAVLIGVGFVIAGLMKLKAASDSGGTQVKYGEGIWRLAVGAGLVAVPALTGVLTSSLGIDGAGITTGAGF